MQIKREKIKKYIMDELENIKDDEEYENIKKRRLKQLKNLEKLEKEEKQEIEKSKVCLETCSKRIRKFAKENKLKANDKESCSLILLMDIVEEGGTSIGVLKEGVFFNKTYTDLRKCLIEKFNVREVISIPQDQFENTSTKTSIIIFDNTDEKTTQVRFSNLIVNRYENDKFEEVLGDIIITENKGDIYDVSDELVSIANKDEILNNEICSLNSKDYNKKIIIPGDDYKLVKLSDICEFMPKSKRNASFGQSTGEYNFYTSSDKVKKCDIADYNEECLIIGSGGIANIKMDNKFSCSADNFILKSKYNHYLYLFFKGNMDILKNGFIGSTLKHLSKEYLINLQISVPNMELKIKEWEDKFFEIYNERNVKKTQIKELEKYIENKIQEICENEECYELDFDNVLKYVNKKNKYKANDGNYEGKYRFYTSSQEKILFRNDYEFENMYILIGKGGNVSIHLASYFSVSNDVYVLSLQNNISCNLSYVYNYLKLNKQVIENCFRGSTIKHLSKPLLSQVKIKIPKNEKLLNKLKMKLEQIQTLQNDFQNLNDSYEQLIKKLNQDAIKS